MSDFAKGSRSGNSRNSYQTRRDISSSAAPSLAYTVGVPTALGLIVQPLDFLFDAIKTKLQVSGLDKMPRYASVSDVFSKNTLKQMYKGFSAGVYSKGVYFLTKYQVYESSKFMFHAEVHKVSTMRAYCGLIIAEFTAMFLSSPLEIIKSRIIAGEQQSTSILQAFKTEKMKLFSRINSINLTRLLVLRASELFTYQFSVEQLVKEGGMEEQSLGVLAISVFLASLAGAITTTPLDVLKTTKSLSSYNMDKTLLKYTFSLIKEKNGRQLIKGFVPLLVSCSIYNTAFFGLQHLRAAKYITY